jgi:hypothetical protein
LGRSRSRAALSRPVLARPALTLAGHSPAREAAISLWIQSDSLRMSPRGKVGRSVVGLDGKPAAETTEASLG